MAEVVRPATRPYGVGDSYRGQPVIAVDVAKGYMLCEDACANVTQFPWTPEPIEGFEVQLEDDDA